MSTNADKPLTDDKHHLSEIEALQRDYDAAESDWECAKDNASALKKIAEEKARKLFGFIRALNAPMPLFDVWRVTPVAELGLPDGITAALTEAGYDTVGKLADYTKAGKELTDIAYIGIHKAEAIREALERFWQQRGGEAQS